ncbi:periplasmic protein [Aliarcobacter thereius]|uniref:Periplasmic protein n=2 Tax=Aliarcobacter thereius TaxID=544718 RepID=A0A1C0B7Z3_9BACT|nr:Spy/CpxP family protein refolding chaperone [Aliarcobacter thereius]OCL87731.1 periplasmic protein [Aliarcobacter thereius]OCL93988.1 periplasmic protein [Aliarcobacter thereius]OCL95382.1 periplasmic protein [Aliarcobacter thereius LMG 24486]OCL99725.1 periplasmic protein [Aliarcobacter thereius]QBF16630.1 putative periplasmic protein refolding chaperone, Spy/CpxP family (LTXXQ domains) [Aliarcobacter thereius LMG 24486]
MKNIFTKKTVLALALVSTLSTALYAQNGDMRNNNSQNCYMQNSDRGMMNHKRSHSKNEMNGMNIFNQLSLTNDQKIKIREIVRDSRSKMVHPYDAFTKNSFDKDKFIKMKKEQREQKIEIQADIMEKAYKVLDAKQKEQLRVLLDIRKEKQNQRFSNK